MEREHNLQGGYAASHKKCLHHRGNALYTSPSVLGDVRRKRLLCLESCRF